MSSIPVYVGLDYHQDSVQVCVLDRKGNQLCNRGVENNAKTIEQVITRYGTPRRIAIEACCGAADLVRVNYLPGVWLAPRSTRELRRLMRHRAQLVRRRKDTKLRVRGLLRENRLKCPDAHAGTKAWQPSPIVGSDGYITNCDAKREPRRPRLRLNKRGPPLPSSPSHRPRKV